MTKQKAPIAVIFANLKGNIGDFAILNAVLLDLRRHYPENPIHVMNHTSLQVDEERFAAFKNTCGVDFEVAPPVHSTRISLPLRGLSLIGLWSFVRPIFVRSSKAIARETAARFDKYAAIFVAGGHQWNGYRGVSMFATLQAIHAVNPRIHCYPFSMHHRAFKLNSPRQLEADVGLIKAPVIVRDSTTKQLLDKISPNVVLGTDCVFGLREMGRAVPAAASRNTSRILLVLTGSPLQVEKDIRAFVQQVKSSFPAVSLLTTCELEDGKTFRKMAKELELEYLAPATWQDAVAEMKSSSLVVSNRLHGLILGSFADVPLLPVTDRSKVAAFAQDSGVPYSTRSIATLDAGQLKKILGDRQNILDALQRFRGLNEKLSMSPLPPG